MQCGELLPILHLREVKFNLIKWEQRWVPRGPNPKTSEASRLCEPEQAASVVMEFLYPA